MIRGFRAKEQLGKGTLFQLSTRHCETSQSKFPQNLTGLASNDAPHHPKSADGVYNCCVVLYISERKA